MITQSIKRNRNDKMILKTEAAKRLSEKAARAEKAAQVWDNHPLFKGQLSKLQEAKVRQDMGIKLTNQARYMRQLNEQETSAEFQRMAPANMMRLVQLSMTNLNRENVFAGYAMETARDAIYYIKPFFSKSTGANAAATMAERSMSFDAAGAVNQDPYGFNTHTAQDEFGVGGYNGNNPAYGGRKQAYNGATNTNARKSIYESAESRFANELANTAHIKVVDEWATGATDGVIEIEWKDGPFGANGENYVPGSTKIYVGTDERSLVAFQDPNTLEYLVAQKYAGIVVVDTPRAASGGAVKTTITLSKDVDFSAFADDFKKKDLGDTKAKINAYARYESEVDLAGQHLGEVNLYMSVYELRPRRTSIGVSWTKLAEITFDSSFNTQVDDLLLTAAADVIHAQLDLQAFKDAYSIALTNPEIYTVEFDAGYASAVTHPGSKDSYVDIANTFSSAIETAGNALYSDIKRGAINKLVVGVSVASYIKLMAGFNPKGLQDPTGVYKIGELDGIEVFKAPIEVIPDNEVLAIYKNSQVENDTAMVYGTLVPFVSNKLELPWSFNTRAGLASFGDKAILNPKYIARIRISNLKDRINTAAYAKMVGIDG